MLKMLVLYSQALLGSLLTMVVYMLVLVAGVRLTDIGLFETYIYATPILALALPSMFGGGTVTNLALGFGASRRLCYLSGRDLADLSSVRRLDDTPRLGELDVGRDRAVVLRL